MKKLIALLVLLALSIPVFGQDDKKDKQTSKEDIILKKLDDLQKSIDSINRELRKDVEKNSKDLKDLKEAVDGMRAEIDALKKANAAAKDTKLKPPPRVEVTRTPKRDYDDLDDDDDEEALRQTKLRIEQRKKRLEEWERENKELQKKDKSPSKTSYNNPPEVQYGKVRIVNTYPTTTYTVTINGERYSVKGGETKVVDYVMPGEFTYQIHGVTEVRKRTLSPNETFTVTIYPQQQERNYSARSYPDRYTPPPVMRYCD